MPAPQYPWQVVLSDLRHRIESGEFPPGAKLPSRRALREHYGVSDTVIGRVMTELAREGLTESLVGFATFVRDRT